MGRPSLPSGGVMTRFLHAEPRSWSAYDRSSRSENPPAVPTVEPVLTTADSTASRLLADEGSSVAVLGWTISYAGQAVYVRKFIVSHSVSPLGLPPPNWFWPRRC